LETSVPGEDDPLACGHGTHFGGVPSGNNRVNEPAVADGGRELWRDKLPHFNERKCETTGFHLNLGGIEPPGI